MAPCQQISIERVSCLLCPCQTKTFSKEMSHAHAGSLARSVMVVAMEVVIGIVCSMVWQTCSSGLLEPLREAQRSSSVSPAPCVIAVVATDGDGGERSGVRSA